MSKMPMTMSDSDARDGEAAAGCLRARSRAVGAMVMAGFAGLWALGGARLSGGGFAADACLAAAALVVALGLGVLRNTPSPSMPLPPVLAAGRRRRGRAVLWSGVGEGLGIFVAVNVVIDAGHPQWQFAAIMAVVGLHFLPLAFALDYKPHLVTGVLLSAWALAYPRLFDAGALAPGGLFGAAAVLIASAAWALRSLRQG
jgi:hypothetical protein